MSRKYWIALISCTVLAALVVAAGVAAFYLVPKYRSAKWLSEARQLVSEGKLEQSRMPFGFYLTRNSTDTAVLEEYAAVCEDIVIDRRRVLTDAARALMRLVQLEPENAARQQRLLDFYRKYRFWSELEDAVNRFGGDDLAAMDADLAYDRVVAVQEQGRLDQAVADLDTYIKSFPDIRDTPLRLARAYRGLRDRAAADALFSTLLAQRPDDTMLKVYYAAYLLDENKTEQAAAALAAVPQGDQGHIDYLIAAIRLAFGKGDFNGALALAEKAIAAYPDHLDAQLNYVLALERSGNRDAAVAYIEQMAPVTRIDTPGFLMFLTEMRLDANDPDGADEARKAYTAAYPDQRSVDQYLTGRILLVRKAVKEARDHFAIASEMNPNLHRANYFLAISELELGNDNAARGPLEQYIRSNPNDQQARRLWSRRFEETRSPLVLRSAAGKMLQTESPDLEELFFVAEDLLALRQEQELLLSRQLMEKAIALSPGDPRGYGALAGYHLERGDIATAEQVLAGAAAAGVNDAEFALLKTSILLLKGDRQGALALAQDHLKSASYDDVQNWAAFLARQGFVAEGDALMKTRTADVKPGAQGNDPFVFRLALALQYGLLDSARSILEEAEAARAQDAAWKSSLNGMRLTLAEGLVVQAAEVPREEVETLLARVQASDPGNEGIKIVQARLILRQPLPEIYKARDIAASVPEDSAAYLQALQVLAEIASIQGQSETAERLARTILASSSKNTAVMHLLADAQLGQRNLYGAQDTLERILKVNRSDTRAMRLLVQIYEQLKLPKRADDMFARFRDTGRNQPYHAAQVEELRAYLGRSESAPAEPNGEVAEDPAAPVETVEGEKNSYASLMNSVRSLFEQGKNAEAIQEIEAYLKKNPNMPEPWVLLGQVILAQGPEADLGVASSAFTQAQIIVPEYGPAQLGQIEIQVRSNNIPVAISICRRYLRQHTRDADVMFRLATLLVLDSKRLNEALGWVEKAITIGERPDFVRLRAQLYTRLGRHDDAIQDMDQLISQAGQTSADDEITLAEAYIGKGDSDNARLHFSEARKLIPENDARLEMRLKDLEDTLAAGGPQ